MRKAAGFASLVLFMAFASALEAKDCRSRLSSGLNPLGETGLSWSLELRGFYYRVNRTSYAFPALGGWLRFEPSGKWSFDLEAVVREKVHLDYERADLPLVQLKTASVQFRGPDGRFSLSAGRQEVQMASGLVLDEFLDAVVADWSGGAVSLKAGAGVLALLAAREALFCQKCLFYEYRSCWKGFCDSSYGDFKTVFAQAAAELGRAGEAGLLYQKVFAADPTYASDIVGAFGRFDLPLKMRLSVEAAAQNQFGRDGLAFGFHADLFRTFRIPGLGSLQVRFQDLYGSRSGSLYFAPTFGNIHLGDRQHYSVRQGHIVGGGLKLAPAFAGNVSLSAGYYAAVAAGLAGLTSDELDARLEWEPLGSEVIRIYLAYARATTRTGPVSQVSLEIRITL